MKKTISVKLRMSYQNESNKERLKSWKNSSTILLQASLYSIHALSETSSLHTNILRRPLVSMRLLYTSTSRKTIFVTMPQKFSLLTLVRVIARQHYIPVCCIKLMALNLLQQFQTHYDMTLLPYGPTYDPFWMTLGRRIPKFYLSISFLMGQLHNIEIK